MTVQELIKVLENMDPDKKIFVYDLDIEYKRALYYSEVDEDGDLVLYP